MTAKTRYYPNFLENYLKVLFCLIINWVNDQELIDELILLNLNNSSEQHVLLKSRLA